MTPTPQTPPAKSTFTKWCESFARQIRLQNTKPPITAQPVQTQTPINPNSQKIGAVHFNPKIQPHLQHNDRTNSNADNIHKELSHLNQCDKSASQALREIDTLYKQAMSKLDEAKKKGKRTQKERSFHEAIFEIDERTTMGQCQELADRIAELTGFRKIQVVLHKDEGHTDEQGNFKPHYHAHAVFFTLDKDTGKQLARQEASLNPRTLSKIQDIASEILQMQRGERHYKDELYQDFLDKKAQNGRKGKIQYQPQAPSRIQSQNDFKRFKDQMRQAQKALAEQKVKADQEILTLYQEALYLHQGMHYLTMLMIKQQAPMQQVEERLAENKRRIHAISDKLHALGAGFDSNLCRIYQVSK